MRFEKIVELLEFNTCTRFGVVLDEYPLLEQNYTTVLELHGPGCVKVRIRFHDGGNADVEVRARDLVPWGDFQNRVQLCREHQRALQEYEKELEAAKYRCSSRPSTGEDSRSPPSGFGQDRCGG